MFINIPESVKIGGLLYSVRLTDQLELGKCYDGEILYDAQIINLRPTAQQRMERNLIHEILHGIFDNLGYSSHEDKQIDELAGAFYALIADNPDLFIARGTEC